MGETAEKIFKIGYGCGEMTLFVIHGRKIARILRKFREGFRAHSRFERNSGGVLGELWESSGRALAELWESSRRVLGEFWGSPRTAVAAENVQDPIGNAWESSARDSAPNRALDGHMANPFSTNGENPWADGQTKK